MEYRLKTVVAPTTEIRITLSPIRYRHRKEPTESDSSESVPLPELLPSGERPPEENVGRALLDIRSEFRTVCQGHSYQRTQFGLSARRRIMQAAQALDAIDLTPSNYLFLTATLPGNDGWAFWAIAEYSAWIMDRFKSWLSKRSRSRLEFYVWEMQKRGALHFHYCLHEPSLQIRERIRREFRDEWVRLLAGVERLSGISLWGKYAAWSLADRTALVQVDVQEVRKSVGAYMSGYVAGKKDKHWLDRRIPFYPKRWFGVSRTLSSKIKDLETVLVNEYADYGAAKLRFDEEAHYLEAYSDKSKIYPHNVGRGETGVFIYYTSDNNQIWESRKMPTINPKQYPNTMYFLRSIHKCLRMIWESETTLEISKLNFSKVQLAVLRDGLYTESVQRGSLHQKTIVALEALTLFLGSRQPLDPVLQGLSKELMNICLIWSANYQEIVWNKHNWMEVKMYQDFVLPKLIE